MITAKKKIQVMIMKNDNLAKKKKKKKKKKKITILPGITETSGKKETKHNKIGYLDRFLHHFLLIDKFCRIDDGRKDSYGSRLF